MPTIFCIHTVGELCYGRFKLFIFVVSDCGVIEDIVSCLVDLLVDLPVRYVKRHEKRHLSF